MQNKYKLMSHKNNIDKNLNDKEMSQLIFYIIGNDNI